MDERNANVEAYDILCKLADYENNSKLKQYLKFQQAFQLMYGYEKYNGSVEKSYKKTLRYSLYELLPQDENIPTKDRVRYGLPVDKETRKKVLKKEFDI